MMEQHPIPQDITGFKFKLVGDMTLVQFGYLAGGLVAGWIFYSTPWYPFVKYPLALLSASAGAAFAFLPIEDRPLAIWVKNFFKSIYQPTFLVWEKTASVPLDSPLLSSQFGGFDLPQLQSIWSFPKRQTSQPAPEPKEPVNSESAVPSPVAPPPPTTPPPPSESEQSEHSQPTSVTLSVDELLKMREEKLTELQQEKTKFDEAKNQSRLSEIQGLEQGQSKVVDISQLEKMREKSVSGPTPEEQLQELLHLNADLVRQIEQIKSSAQQLTLGDQRSALEKELAELAQSRESLTLKIAALQQAINNPQPTTAPVNVGQNINIVPKFVRPAPTVSLSDLPNVVSGLVKDSVGNPVLGAIVLINDKSGNPVRALKTNKIGQFITNTPLDNGTYYIEIEKEGFNFDTMSAQLTGQVLPLLEIKGRIINGGGPIGSI